MAETPWENGQEKRSTRVDARCGLALVPKVCGDWCALYFSMPAPCWRQARRASSVLPPTGAGPSEQAAACTRWRGSGLRPCNAAGSADLGAQLEHVGRQGARRHKGARGLFWSPDSRWVLRRRQVESGLTSPAHRRSRCATPSPGVSGCLEPRRRHRVLSGRRARRCRKCRPPERYAEPPATGTHADETGHARPAFSARRPVGFV